MLVEQTGDFSFAGAKVVLLFRFCKFFADFLSRICKKMPFYFVFSRIYCTFAPQIGI